MQTMKSESVRSPAKHSPAFPARAVAAEALGTAFLLATVVGSGIMGERLSGGNVAIALLANSLATGCALAALILALGPVSGAHMNPLVTLWVAAKGGITGSAAAAFIAAQALGAFAGTAAANLMFDLPAYTISTHARAGAGQWIAEAVATFGLLLVIAGSSRRHPLAPPFAVAGYITAAYWFTSSTSFANPAVTLARMATETFSGIRPADAPTFLAAQAVGALAAAFAIRFLFPPTEAFHDR